MAKPRDKKNVVITDPHIQEYAERMTTPESHEIQNLVRSSDSELEYIDMLSGKLVGQLLKMLVKISGARRILEIGTFTGYSALTMAEALPVDGEIITIEMNLRYQELAQKHFDHSENGKKVKMVKGNAVDILDEIEGQFDMVFLDADKIRYPLYYEKVLPKLKSGGIMITDNVLWDGTVLNPQDEKAKAIDEFNTMIAEDERVEQVLLPVRDGLSVLRKS